MMMLPERTTIRRDRSLSTNSRSRGGVVDQEDTDLRESIA